MGGPTCDVTHTVTSASLAAATGHNMRKCKNRQLPIWKKSPAGPAAKRALASVPPAGRCPQAPACIPSPLPHPTPACTHARQREPAAVSASETSAQRHCCTRGGSLQGAAVSSRDALLVPVQGYPTRAPRPLFPWLISQCWDSPQPSTPAVGWVPGSQPQPLLC